ncbi:hypothetical protein Syun_002881 [Stephania yunnanensis]|uniref:Leucine-rich repeat-containing N-terminal plant-type domain-containing protein n=1 Tax=Stephania yunnanensis TaxID=152371 RepID=A0AAP0Q134_9MAGN
MACLAQFFYGNYSCNSHYWSLLLFFISFLNQVISSSSSSTSNSTHKACLRDQSSALLQFKSSITIDEYIAHSNLWSWEPNTSCCSWQGVTCNGYGFVIGLDASESGLSGMINSSTSLFKLRRLEKLNLAYNEFFPSSIPTAIIQLHSLTHLNLSSSGFSGQVPIEIYQLTSLVSLDFSFLHGLQSPNIESLSKNMPSLRELRLDGLNASISGWQQLFSSPKLHNLQVLSLSNCQLYGSVMSSSLSSLSSLSVLVLSMNDITHFPIEMFSLPNLQVLDLTANFRLAGSLPEFQSSSALRELVLPRTKFSGTIPSSIGNLKRLTKLDLSQCEFYGSIPFSLWHNLDQLMFLDLGHNNFSGELPSDSLSNLSRLVKLFLWNNSFSGRLPSIKSSSRTITQVYLSTNRFTGSIPDSYVDGLPNLGTLHLSNNLLTGSVPSSLFTKLPSLEFLSLGDNQLSGELQEFAAPASSQLYDINLCGNMLEGRIPTSFLKLPSLRGLSLCSNRFEGVLNPQMFMGNVTNIDFSNNRMLSIDPIDVAFTIPDMFGFFFSSCNLTEFPLFLKHQETLSIIDLSDNQLTGKVPAWLWNKTQTLNISHNLLDGFEQPVPDPSSSNLRILDLRSNKFDGPIPDLPTTLGHLLLSDNNFTQVPVSICNLNLPVLLDLSNNRISGSIPPCLGKLATLNVLDLSKNKFSGSIRQEFDQFCNLNVLNLNANQLEGLLPRSLANCLRLQILDLGNNRINDTFPFWLESLEDLQVLRLRSNNFHDAISGYRPSSNAISFPSLHIIDLSSNSFTGHLPLQYFKSSRVMTMPSQIGDDNQVRLLPANDNYYGYSLLIKNKGQELSYLYDIIYLLNAVDFSSNKFEGEIPELVGDFKSLSVLNLSYNSIGGRIPSSLGNLRKLQSLDLSNNKLSGEIPPEFTSLTFLSVLNVSMNKLVGRIPSAAQFSTFPSNSFEGNLGLCGSQMHIECNRWRDDAPPTSSSSEKPQENPKSTIIDWKFAVAGYGGGIIVGVVVEHFILVRNMYYLGKILSIKRLIQGDKSIKFFVK